MSYATLSALALRLINKRGRTVTLLRTLKTTPVNTAKPWEGPQKDTLSCTTKGAFFDPFNSEDNFDFAVKLNYRSDVKRVDWHIYIPASGLTFVPDVGDRVMDVLKNQEYQVVTVSPTGPGETDIFYLLQVQK